jgi:hypothetical protein
MIRQMLIMLMFVMLLAGCALPPDKPVTRDELMETKIYQIYIIVESPEQVLDRLNTYGEVVLEAKRNIPGKNYLVHVKLLATADGIEVVDYDR